jgi:hypothetical protein
MGASSPVQAAIGRLFVMSRGLTRFLIVAAAAAALIAIAIHLLAPEAVQALGRSLHGG